MSIHPNEANSLRTEAEAQLSRAPQTDAPARSAEELLHELRVHQIELEMQNEELRRAQVALEESRDHYVDLYEFSPVGYLTLNSTGMIEAVNLTAAALLGAERKKLLDRRFAHYVQTRENELWYRHFTRTLQHNTMQSCELVLQRSDDSVFHAQLDCLRTINGQTASVRIALTDISERKRAEHQLRELSAHLQSVREEEKARMAREIHDELGGTLAVLKMNASRMLQKLAEDKKMEPLLEHAESMYSLLDNALNATRHIVTDLRPAMLDDLGLLAALEWQGAKFHKHTCIECRVTGYRNKSCHSGLDRIISINLFRIFQEALTNAARHSGASRVEAELHQDEAGAMLLISDNGCGLAQEHNAAPTCYGIRGMRERVEQLGGQITFDSPPGGGLRLTVRLPQPNIN
jgi:PAS domain S-box-containing protein